MNINKIFIALVKSYYYRNKLPHIQPTDGTFFITFRLKGSIPANKLGKISDLEQSKNDYSKLNFKKLKTESHFSIYNSTLDSSKHGPVYLKDDKVACIVAGSIKYLDEKDYTLICYTIMPNHVHLIINKIRRQLFDIMQTLKGYTAYWANRQLKRKGAFWQKEYYDRVINSENELYNTINYTLNNPVKAKLVKNWQEWKYSYINDNYSCSRL